ncbi:amine oxidase [Gloeophyllum trabeum ATCC 11539]|uniref:Amine oxidase n=1 Tax=Gloeophyllum trabeum (strain ATCC 11539 / FP-39264 / Madison 617) TaxID=670483 RepID=S7RUZ6_GLOTA|nr:amine oxidase [Gloeophyllum trabeum ATCC 11539]EPQ57024.1 amine oxidase [Gloeophyllum trabeum ATCC 11539]
MIKTLPTVDDVLPVAIIGAGMAGLYTAMILDSLDLKYEILEASDHVGGRMFTYKFQGGSQYDYYDVGAMRFPGSPYMRRIFKLVEDLTLKLIPYKFSADNTFMYFNHRRYQPNPPSSDPPADPFQAKGYVPDEYLVPGNPGDLMAGLLKPYRDPFMLDIPSALENLYKQDRYSTRTYMSLACDPPYPAPVINWCETLEDSTGSYDRAFTETVLDSVAFEFPGDKEYSWYCFDGGSSVLPKKMEELLGTPITFNARVNRLVGAPDTPGVFLTVDGEIAPRTYSSVFCTAPLPCLNTMDLENCGLDYATWNAIRELQYGPSTKIGILFSKPWWQDLSTGPISGGQSYTDLMIRRVVYPSYPENGTPSNVIIASYCWTQDAERMGSLIREGPNTPGPDLIDLVLRDLARVHDVEFSYLKSLYKAHHAYDWMHDPLTMGAFAYFGPQQFNFMESVFNNLTKPICGGKLFIAGEATSSCHAWVAGALESSWRAVEMYLRLHHADLLDKFHEKWGTSEYWEDEGIDAQLRIGLAQSFPEAMQWVPATPGVPLPPK